MRVGLVQSVEGLNRTTTDLPRTRVNSPVDGHGTQPAHPHPLLFWVSRLLAHYADFGLAILRNHVIQFLKNSLSRCLSSLFLAWARHCIDTTYAQSHLAPTTALRGALYGGRVWNRIPTVCLSHVKNLCKESGNLCASQE